MWILGGALAVLAGACSAFDGSHEPSSDVECHVDGDCPAHHCLEGTCVACLTSTDCGPGRTCVENACRQAGCLGDGDCPSGETCDVATAVCQAAAAAPPPVCGQADLSGGFDAGWGPPPSVSGSICYSCAGCPRGSECLCGASGILGGLRCKDIASGAACFLTGAGGTCQVFPGDCASNAQCEGTPSTPVCSQDGECVACVRDSDCAQDAGARGCVQNQCVRCCASDDDCAATSSCTNGFCYANPDGGVHYRDAGEDAAADAQSEAGADAGDAGDAAAMAPDAGDAGDAGPHADAGSHGADGGDGGK